MIRNVHFLPKESIEQDAMALLGEYQQARGVTIAAPIPIEEIVEEHLELRLEFDDLHARHNVPRPASGEADILGAIYGDGSICIDASLDPDEYPHLEGRYRFTLAHEGGGHWRLHRSLILNESSQTSLFAQNSEPAFICRTSQARESVEWQADFYASCLLMPRRMIFAAWEDLFADRKPRVLQPKTPIEHSYVEIPKQRLQLDGDVLDYETDEKVLERFCKPLAERFMVSPIAMRIRLENLGLLYRVVPLQRLLGER